MYPQNISSLIWRIFFLAVPHSLQYLSSSSRTRNESAEPQSVDCQGIPNDLKKTVWSLLQRPLVCSRKNRHDRYILSLELPPQLWENILLLFKPLSLWSSGVRDQGVGRMGLFQGLSHWLIDGHHLSAFRGLLGVSVPLISSYKDTNHIGLGFTLVASFYLDYLFQHPVSKYCHILRYWSLRL